MDYKDSPKERCNTDNKIVVDLIKQIHEQFAVNNHSTFASLITLFIALIVVLGWYCNLVLQTFNHCEITSAALVFATLCCDITMVIIIIINLYQGLKFRKEQSIIDKIRNKFDKKGEFFGINGCVNWKLKKKSLISFLPGLYGVFFYLSSILILLINTCTWYVITNIIPFDSCNSLINNIGILCFSLILTLIIIISFWMVVFSCFCNIFKIKDL